MNISSYKWRPWHSITLHHSNAFHYRLSIQPIYVATEYENVRWEMHFIQMRSGPVPVQSGLGVFPSDLAHIFQRTSRYFPRDTVYIKSEVANRFLVISTRNEQKSLNRLYKHHWDIKFHLWLRYRLLNVHFEWCRPSRRPIRAGHVDGALEGPRYQWRRMVVAQLPVCWIVGLFVATMLLGLWPQFHCNLKPDHWAKSSVTENWVLIPTWNVSWH